MISPVRREACEEGVEVIGGLIVEEDLEIRDLGIQSLVSVLELNRVRYVLNLKEGV